MNFEDLCTNLTSFISKISDETISKDTLLLDEGMIDSFNVLEIITFMEKCTGIRINPTEVTIEHFASIRSLATWMTSYTELSQTK